jgi:hypothetical protein
MDVDEARQLEDRIVELEEETGTRIEYIAYLEAELTRVRDRLYALEAQREHERALRAVDRVRRPGVDAEGGCSDIHCNDCYEARVHGTLS